LQGTNVGLCSAFKIEQPVEGFGHRCTNHHHPVVSHDHHLLFRVAQQGGTAFAFLLERQPAIGIVNHIPVEERRAIPVNRRQI